MTSASPDPFFSVVITTFNGVATIRRTIESVLDQTLSRDHYEVIVIDDGSSQDIHSAVSAYPVRFERLNVNGGVAVARNRALEIARGKVFVGIDDDCTAEPEWLARIADGYRTPDVIGVGGVLKPAARPCGLVGRYLAASETGAPPPTWSDAAQSLPRRFWVYLKRQFVQNRPVDASGVCRVGELYGANGSFPVEVLRCVGGWDPSMHGVEDTDICRRIRMAYPGRSFLSIATGRIVHGPQMSVRSFLMRSIRRGPVTLSYYQVHNLTPPFFPYPIVYAAALAVALALVPAAFLAIVVVLPLFLYVWWPLRAVVKGELEHLVFAYVELAEEGAVVIGLLYGYIRGQYRRVYGAAVAGYHPRVSFVTRTYTYLRLGVTRDERHLYRRDQSILLTFDDYGTAVQIDSVLRILAEHEIRAVFFLTGDWAQEHPELVTLIRAAGHGLGNHTYSHANLLTLSSEQRQLEITNGLPSRWLRPPMGRYNAEIRRYAHAHGMRIAYWSVDSDDWKGVSEEYIYKKVIHEARPGSVILFHLHADNTALVLPRLILALKRRGLVFAGFDLVLDETR